MEWTKEELKIKDEAGISFVEKICGRDKVQKPYPKLKSVDFYDPDNTIERAFNPPALPLKANKSVWQKLIINGNNSSKSNLPQKSLGKEKTIVSPRKKSANWKKSRDSFKRKVFKRTQDSHTSLNELLRPEEKKRSDIEGPGLFNLNQPV